MKTVDLSSEQNTPGFGHNNPGQGAGSGMGGRPMPGGNKRDRGHQQQGKR